MNSLINYLKETRAELKHVSWPTRSQLLSYTLLVVGLSTLVATLLGAFDYVFTSIFRLFI